MFHVPFILIQIVLPILYDFLLSFNNFTYYLAT